MSKPVQSYYYDYAQASAFGALRGLVALPVEHPFDTVKTCCQANPHTPIFQTIRNIHLEKGWKGFYSGAIPNGIRLVVKQTYRWPMMIGFPPFFQKHIPNSTQERFPSMVKAATGISIASFETFIINPAERLKVYLMTHHGAAGEKNLTAFFHKHRARLLPEMMRGVNFMYIRQITTWVSFQVTDDKMKRWEKQRTGVQQLSFPSLMKVAFAVGAVNTVAHMPFDMVKTNLQKEGHITNRGIFKTVQTIFKEHGFLAFYSGWQMRMLQYMIQSAFTVTVLDRLEQQMKQKAGVK